MKKTLVYLLIVVAPLTGCTHWEPYSIKSPDQAQQDKEDCEYETEKYGHVAMWSDSLGGAICSGVEEGTRRAKLMGYCMNQKGYRLVRN
jgi:hypothetical protein